MSAARGNPTQRLVRETMVAAGGYWRPLAAVARLLEELGELSELLARESPAEELSGELADLWIITAALADQFLAEVPEPGATTTTASGHDTSALLEAAGPIARVVNHYDGPKLPRAASPLPTLADAVGAFHSELAGLAARLGVELRTAVTEKIRRIHARGDIERFGRDGFDPSTAPLIESLSEALAAGLLPARLWAAPDLGLTAQVAWRAQAARPPLEIFAKAARAERLEGFVIAGPEPVALSGAGAWLGALVAALDPEGSAAAFEVAGAGLSAAGMRLPGDARVYALLRPA